MSPQCYRKGQSTYLVRLSVLSHSFHMPDRRHLMQLSINTHTDKGTAKIARDLGVDHAEAVVRA